MHQKQLAAVYCIEGHDLEEVTSLSDVTRREVEDVE